MGCLTLTTQRKGGARLTSDRVGGASLLTNRIGGLDINVALVCPVGLGNWEYLEVDDGLLLTNEGEKFLVKKQKD